MFHFLKGQGHLHAGVPTPHIPTGFSTETVFLHSAMAPPSRNTWAGPGDPLKSQTGELSRQTESSGTPPCSSAKRQTEEGDPQRLGRGGWKGLVSALKCRPSLFLRSEPRKQPWTALSLLSSRLCPLPPSTSWLPLSPDTAQLMQTERRGCLLL